MPENWNTYKLGEVATFHYGKSLTAGKRLGGDIPVYSSAGITGWHNEALAKSKGIIVGRKGTVGSVYYSNQPFFCIDTAYYITPKNDIYDLKFLYYKLLSLNLPRLTADSAVPGLNRETAYAQEILLPEIEEQRRIAEILSALDEKIELNLEMNRTLERIAQATFKHWFVDFQFPGFDGELVDGLPKGWRKVRLEDLVDTISVTHKFPNDEIIFLNTSDILEGEVLSHKYSNAKTLPGQAKKSIKKNDILFSEIRPANKRYAFIDFDADDYVVSTKLMVLRAKSDVDPMVLYYFLKSDDVLRELQMLAESRSGTFPQITFFHIKNLEMIVPTEDLLEKHTSLLKSGYEKITANNQHNKILIQIRDGLLPKLMSGKIRVGE